MCANLRRRPLAVCCVLWLALGHASASRSDDAPSPKQALFDLIANDEQQYYGVGPYPELPVERWEARIEISGFAPNHETVLAELMDAVMSPIATQASDLKLPEFPGITIEKAAANPNVLFLVGDDWNSLMDAFPQKDMAVWRLMTARARQVLSEAPGVTCGRVVGSDQAMTIVAVVIFIATREGAGDPKRCAALAMADILGLRGRAGVGTSIKSVDGDSVHLRALDLEALGLLYGPTVQHRRSLSHAVDDYLAARGQP